MADHDPQPGAARPDRNAARAHATAQRPLARTPKPPALPGLIGNRAFTQFVRTLARDDGTSHAVHVYLVGPPPPVHAGRRATPGNRDLAAEIDALEGVNERDLRTRRETEAQAISDPGQKDLALHRRRLQAIEYVLQWRHAGGPLGQSQTPDGSTARLRRNLLDLLEKGITRTGSFEEAVKHLDFAEMGAYEDSPTYDDAHDQLKFFQEQAKDFQAEFRSQASATAKRMLATSREEIVKLIKSYGLDDWTVLSAAHMMAAHYHDLEDEVARVMKNSSEHPDVENTKSAVHMRWNLAKNAAWIREQQAVVKQAQHEVNKDTYNVPINKTTGPEWEALKRDQARLDAAQQELQTRWILAEGVNPVLAEYRRGSAIENADLSALDTTDPEAEMGEVLRRVLPTLRDIERAEGMLLGPKPEKSPLTVPAIVTATRASMFIPRGSLQDGAATDAVNDAIEDGQESWLVRLGEIVLAIVATVATGGTALVADLALAGVGVYEAQRAWADYSKDKTLADTNLDLARSLATQEPSLAGFAVALIFAGVAAVPAIGLFAKAMKLKALIKAGEDGSKIIDELNAVKKGLGDQAAAEIKEGEKIEQEAAGAEKSGDGGGKDPNEPEVGHGGKSGRGGGGGEPSSPPGSKFKNATEVRDAVRRALSTSEKGPNIHWNELWAKVDRRAFDASHPGIAKSIDRIHGLLHDPQAIEDAFVDLWEAAARTKKTEQEALIDYFGGKAGMPVVKKGNTTQEFIDALKQEKPLIDEAEQATDHGAYTHMFQEYVLAQKIGKQAASDFRRALAAAPGPPADLVSLLWDGIYDEYTSMVGNKPEYLYQHLKRLLNFT